MEELHTGIEKCIVLMAPKSVNKNDWLVHTHTSAEDI